MSNTSAFIVKAYATAIVGFFLVVGVHQLSMIEAPAPAPAPTVAKVTKVAKSTPRYRGLEETRTKKKSKAEIVKEFEMVQAYRARKARIENGTASTWDHILNTPL